jgi:alpha-L-fucosidase
LVSLSVPEERVQVFYTLDGKSPDNTSLLYSEPILVETPTQLKAVSFDPDTESFSSIIERRLDIPKQNWTVVSVSSGNMESAINLMDENPLTFWATESEVDTPQEIALDLGKLYTLNGFTYWPNQERYPIGIITSYEFFSSTDGKRWTKLATGEFDNIVNSRVEQQIYFEPIEARYIKLRAAKTSEDGFQASFGEIGIITDEK